MIGDKILSYRCVGEETATGIQIEVHDSGRVTMKQITPREDILQQEREISVGEVRTLVERIAAYEFIRNNRNPSLGGFDGEHVEIEISLGDKQIKYGARNTSQFAQLYCTEIKQLTDLFR